MDLSSWNSIRGLRRLQSAISLRENELVKASVRAIVDNPDLLTGLDVRFRLYVYYKDSDVLRTTVHNLTGISYSVKKVGKTLFCSIAYEDIDAFVSVSDRYYVELLVMDREGALLVKRGAHSHIPVISFMVG